MNYDLSEVLPNLIQRYQAGYSLRELAAESGFPPRVIRDRISRAGVEIRPQYEVTAHARQRRSAEQRRYQIDEDSLREYRMMNMSCKAIAGILGCSEGAVQLRLKELGLPSLSPRTRRRPRGGYYADPDGYILVLMPEHREANFRGYVRQHRIVMEQMLGRPLAPGEVVDHRNYDTSDNRPENLRLFASNADHMKATRTGKKNMSREERERFRQEAVQCACQRIDAILAESGNDAPQ